MNNNGESGARASDTRDERDDEMRNGTLKGRIAQFGSLILIGLLAACSGGGGGQSSSSPAAVTSAASEGPISGFGSVIMNGVRWNTDDADFEINGRSGSQDDLSLGMMVRVEGQRFADGSARADRVVYDTRLRGPIRNIEVLSPDSRALEIFGLRVIVSRADTRFDRTDLEDLTTNRVVDVSGFMNAVGELEATHLRRRDEAVVNQTEVKFFGAVSGLAGGSFILGTSQVLFDDDTEFEDFPESALRDGLEVRVEGVLLANDDIAAEEIESPRGDDDSSFGEVEFQGVVSDFVSLANFQVAGRPVDASDARFEPADASLLQDGIRVEVEGFVNGAGVLIADEVEFRSNRVEINAEVAADEDIDSVGGTLFLLGIPIDLDSRTELEDDRDDLAGFSLSDIRGGDFLEIEGIATPDGRVIATEIARAETGDLELEGPVDMIDLEGRVFTILGVTIPTDASTEFENDGEGVISESDFYARLVPGLIVNAEDEEDGNQAAFDVADEVEIEEPDLEEGRDDEYDDDDDDDDYDDDDHESGDDHDDHDDDD